jgi:hypothetical protein
MADRNASQRAGGTVSSSGGKPTLHIDSLRIRVSGRDAADGRKLASEVASTLGEQGRTLVGAPGSESMRIGGLRLSVRQPASGNRSTDTSKAIVRAIAEAVDSARGERPRRA